MLYNCIAIRIRQGVVAINRYVGNIILFLLTIAVFSSGCSGSSPAAPFRSEGVLGNLDIPAANWAQDEVLVYFGEAAPSLPQLNRFASANNLELIKEHSHFWGDFYQFRITDATGVREKCAELLEKPGVEVCEPNYRIEFTGAPKERYWPDDPLWESATDADSIPGTSVDDHWGPCQTGADLVWPDAMGDGVVIAVIDTAINPHEDLDPNLWTNADEIPSNGIDDDDNGHIDDIHGWNFGNDSSDYSGPDGHGTVCAGTAVARGDNGKGACGVAPRAELMCIAIAYGGWEGYVSGVMDGLDYAYNEGADIVSMSFVTPEYSWFVENACAEAWEDGNGMLLVGAAGNNDSDTPFYPAAEESVVCAGATCSFDPWVCNPWSCRRITTPPFLWGSNYGPHLEIMAPGYLIWTTVGDNYSGYTLAAGTSISAPFIAGAYALLKSAYPDLTSGELRDLMNRSADDLGGPGKDIYYGYGRVNIFQAVYGPDPNQDLEDTDGFVPILAEDVFFDNINNNVESEYYDSMDLYKYTSIYGNELNLTVDIFTWGENLILAVYDNPELKGEPIAVSDQTNDPPYNWEKLAIDTKAGESYYIAVTAHSPGDCTSYRLVSEGDDTVDGVRIWIESSPEGEFVSGDDNAWIGKATIEALSGTATLDELTFSLNGNLSSDYVESVKLYFDTNESGQLEPDVDELAYISDGLHTTNRITIDLDGLKISNGVPVEFLIALDLSVDAPSGKRVCVGVVSYKDLKPSAPNFVYHSNLPQFTDLKQIS